MKAGWIWMASALAIVGCANDSDGNATASNAATAGNEVNTAAPAEASAAAPGSARAELRLANGSAAGTATVTQSGDGLLVTVAGTGLPAGDHGVHVHMTGACDAPTFETAGGHWNPTGAQHGSENPAGMHKGDLPNLVVAADGSGTLSFTVEGASISGGANGLLDSDGAAVVVHESAADYRPDPSGASGGRIACGVLQAG